jgi:ATP-binding cassette subfamily F protein 3
LLAGEISPIEGLYETSAGLRIGYFAQHQLEFLRGDDSPIAHIQRLDKKATEQSLRDYLGGFGFRGDNALSKVAPMSGGEKARLVLALTVYQKPNLLLLDEPTNHLDLDMRHALNIALQGFEGAMVLISHDRFLLTSVCDDFYLVDSKQVQAFDGDLDDYKDWILKGDKGIGAESDKTSVKPDRKNTKRLEAEFRQATKPIRKAIEKHEKVMADSHKNLQVLEDQLSDTDIYSAEKKPQLKQVLAEQAELKSNLEDIEMEWLDAQEQLEVKQKAFEQECDD